MSEDLQKITRKRSLPDEAVAQIEALIQSRRLTPGDKLPTEAALARSFGVSRSVIREAIARLRQDGVVRSRHGVGAFVANPGAPRTYRLEIAHGSTEADQDIFELRLAIEPQAAALAAARCDVVDVSRMRRALNDIARAVAEGADGAEADLQFHGSILAATRNRLFVQIGALLADHVREQIRPTRSGTPTALKVSTQMQAEHEAILVAIASRDISGATTAATRHVENAATRLGYAGNVAAARRATLDRNG